MKHEERGDKPLTFPRTSDVIGGILLIAAFIFLAFAMLTHASLADRRAQCSYYGGTVVEGACLMPTGGVP